MNKTPIKDYILDYAYSPIEIDDEFKQRIIYPKKKIIKIYGVRYIKQINDEVELKIYRKKKPNNSI